MKRHSQASSAPGDAGRRRAARPDAARAQRDADDRRERKLQRHVVELQRVRGQQHQRGRGDRRPGRRPPADQVGAHADRQHQRRPQGRDRLAGHQREERDAGQGDGGGDRARVDVEGQARNARRRRADEDEQQRRHGRQMQPRDRQHVGRAGDAESLLDVGVDAAAVAEHGGLEERRRVAASARDRSPRAGHGARGRRSAVGRGRPVRRCG